jgi:hypothetical protein
MKKKSKVESEESVESVNRVSDEDIAERAYFLYEQRGKVPGYELQDWLQAERELTTPIGADWAA